MSAPKNPDARQDANADYREIAKFTELAEQWWDKNGPFKPLHDINPLRLDWIDQQCFAALGSPLAGKRVLDVGAGGGILAHSMAQKGAQVLGIDLGEANVQAALLRAQKTQLGGLDFRCVAVEDLAKQTPESYDVVTCMEMLEHVPDPSSVVRACAALLKPGGLLALSTINKNPKAFLFAIVGAEYVLRLLKKGTHDYNKFIEPTDLDRMAKDAGCRLLDSTGLHYNPLSKRYWLSSANLDVNYMMAYQKERP